MFSAQPVLGLTACPPGTLHNPQDAYVYNVNHGAVYWLERSQDTMDGVRSTEDLIAGWPDDNTGLIHPLQISSPATTDFIGWGTTTGQGTSGGITNCATNYNNYQIYYDYGTNGGDDYYCHTGLGYVAHGAVNQLFQIRYNNATIRGGSSGWVISLNGSPIECLHFSWHASHFVAVGVEISSYFGSIPYVQSAIDTDYNQLQLHGTVTGTWDDWGSNSVPCAELVYGYGVDIYGDPHVLVHR
jgi:hypothetical protein